MILGASQAQVQYNSCTNNTCEREATEEFRMYKFRYKWTFTEK
jgi:hypothetical protein